MGPFDSDQIADLVSIYIFYTLGRIINLNNIGDGLISIPTSTDPLHQKY